MLLPSQGDGGGEGGGRGAGGVGSRASMDMAAGNVDIVVCF